MMSLRLVWASIRLKPLGWGFHILSLALGVSVVIALDTALDNRFQRDLGDVDL